MFKFKKGIYIFEFLICIKMQFRISGKKIWQKIWNGCGLAAHRHVQNCKYNFRAMSFEQFDLFHVLAFDLTSQQHYKWCCKSAKTMIFYYGLDEQGLTAMQHVS